jgi:hypothetical protein
MRPSGKFQAIKNPLWAGLVVFGVRRILRSYSMSFKLLVKE